MSARGPVWFRIERLLVLAIAAHSAAIGVGALVATEWGLRFGGFGTASPLFFPRQVGIFHVVVAFAYLVEHFRYRAVAVLLTTKAIAVVFLGAMIARDELPWVVPVSAGGDALMFVAVLLVHRARRGAESTFASRSDGP
jgi:hypothetical protein